MNTVSDLPAIRAALREYIPRGNVWALSGSANARQRQALMLALTGQKLPQAKCGVTAISAVINSAIRPAGDCMALRQNFVRQWLAGNVELIGN
jgi:cytochrome P450